MSVDTFKAQAHRLQGYLRSNPDTATRLAQGKQAACYDAIAAVHGARNWNTLCAVTSEPGASASPEFFCAGPAGSATTPPDLPPLECFGELLPGPSVIHLAGASSVSLSADLVNAFSDGYQVTVLSTSGGFQHLALAMGGAAGEVEAFCDKPVDGYAFLALQFRGPAARAVPWFDIPDGGAAACVQRLARLLRQRSGRGSILVLDDIQAVLGLSSEGTSGLVAALREFNASGGRLVLTAGSLAGLKSLSRLNELLPPTSVLVASRGG